MISKYTVLAAIYCLLRYVENTTGSMFCQDSLRSVSYWDESECVLLHGIHGIKIGLIFSQI